MGGGTGAGAAGWRLDVALSFADAQRGYAECVAAGIHCTGSASSRQAGHPRHPGPPRGKRSPELAGTPAWGAPPVRSVVAVEARVRATAA